MVTLPIFVGALLMTALVLLMWLPMLELIELPEEEEFTAPKLSLTECRSYDTVQEYPVESEEFVLVSV